jgi:hypothetical protein
MGFKRIVRPMFSFISTTERLAILETFLEKGCLGNRPKLEIILSIIVSDNPYHPLRAKVEEALASLPEDRPELSQ